MKIEDKKLRIGIDIDDVLVAFIGGYLSFHNKKHNTNFNLEDVTNYHLWECGIHKSREEDILEVLEFQNSTDFENLSLIEGARNGLEKIANRYKIYLISSRPEEVKERTRSYFDFSFPKNGFEIIFSGEIYGGKLSKSEICKNLEIPLIIEDNPNYSLNCAKEGIKVFLLDKPWNKNYKKHKNITKVKEWGEILEKLEIEK